MARRHSWEADRTEMNINLITARLMIILFVVALSALNIKNYGNPIEKYIAGKSADKYLSENYPDIYEQVLGANSGRAHHLDDGTWCVHYYARENGEYMLADTTLLQFDIVTDKKGKILRNGYEEYYLKGGSLYDKYSWDYYYNMIQFADEYFRDADIFYPLVIDSYNVDHNTAFTTKSTRQTVYYGEYLDPEKEYDINSLAAKYGNIDLWLRTESCTRDEYSAFVQKLRKLLDENNMAYSTMHVYMYVKTGEISVYEVIVTYDDMHSKNPDVVIKNKLFRINSNN